MNRLFSFRALFTSGLPGRSLQRRKAKAGSSAPEVLEVRAMMSGNHLTGLNDLHSRDVGSTPSGNVPRIVNGTVTTQYPSVGLIGDASGMHCTGTLIAPQFVLTAGHCAEGMSATAGRFQVGGQTYQTTQVYIHPNYNGNQIGSDSANDIAIFKLDRVVTGVTPSPIYRATPAVGQLLTLVGFGGGGTGNTGTNGDFGTKRVGTTPIDGVTAKLITWNFDNNNESNTAPGDSGGPAFLTIGGVNYVAGVTSGGDNADASIGDHSFDTRVDAYAAWIDSIVGTTVSSTLVSIKATDAAAAETTTGQTANSGLFTVTRTGSTTSSLTVNLTINGSATNGTDYTQIPVTVTIPAGSASATIPVSVKDDAVSESSETVIVAVAAGTGYAIDTASASGTVNIADNDAVKSNDLFANRVKLSGTAAQATGTNVGASRETGEPNIAGVSGGKSVWWTWTADVSGQVTITTVGSAFDTTLGVYRGTAVNALTRVVTNDDENYSTGIYTSKVVFSAVAGQTYQIAVDGYEGETGAIRLNLTQTAGRTKARTQIGSDARVASSHRRAELRAARTAARDLLFADHHAEYLDRIS